MNHQVADRLNQQQICQQQISMDKNKQNIDENSLIKKKRVDIFKTWQMGKIVDLSKYSEPAFDSTLAFKRTRQMITEAQQLISNIQWYNSSQTIYLDKINKSKSEIKKLIQNQHSRCQSQNEEKEDIQNLFYDLNQMYIEVRKARTLDYQLTNYFQNANMANYDHATVQIIFTDSLDEVKTEIRKFIDDINNNISRLWESLMALEDKIQLNGLSGVYLNFQEQFNKLETLMNHNNIIRIHSLMLHKLQNIRVIVKQFQNFIRISETEYLKYQIIYDCFCLMNNEANDMQKYQSQLVKLYQQFEQNNQINITKFTSFYRNCQRIINAIECNKQIYQSNLLNFNRVGAEVEMVSFYKKNARFITNLQSLRKHLNDWKTQGNSIKSYYQIYQQVMQYHYQGLFHQNLSKEQLKNVRQLYEKCANLKLNAVQQQIKKRNFRIKQFVVKQIQNILNKYQ